LYYSEIAAWCTAPSRFIYWGHQNEGLACLCIEIIF